LVSQVRWAQPTLSVSRQTINALANVEGVRVVSRTSAFAFKGKNPV